MSSELTPVSEILADMPLLGGNETSDTEPDNTPGASNYNWEKYGYSLITEETFEGGYHEGDYEKDGVIHCGYCHTPKQVLHIWQGELRAFPINCQCKKECLARIEAERIQREKLEKAELCRQHALPYAYMHQWTFASDDGSSPKATGYDLPPFYVPRGNLV